MFDIQENVRDILESIDGSLVIDDAERIVFMCSKLIDLIGAVSFDHVYERRLRDVIETNMTWRVLETGERQIGVTYLVQGYTVVSNAYPIYRDNKLIGAIEYDVFEDAHLLREFLNKMSSREGLEQYSALTNRIKREKYTLESIKGSSSVLRAMKNEIKLSSRSNSTVLITGETGTGKELIAQAIHMAGHRSFFEFVEVNCSTIPMDLFESELFGYEEGSFTGARKGGKRGLAQIADKGTLFLDEVGTLPGLMQAKLLRFLQEKEIRPVGGDRSVPVDARIICATNVELSELVARGQFREDLYYRLNVIHIKAEPLRSRRSDIPELVNHFIEELNVSLERHLRANRIRSIDKDALKMLMDYHWPGNIRELKNAIERAINRCAGNTLLPRHFKEFPGQEVYEAGDATKNDTADDAHEFKKISIPLAFYDLSLKELRNETERDMFEHLLNVRGLSVKAAADSLGITRQMLYKRMNALGIRRRSREASRQS
jgi:transcriptional regulator with PAS, ATPase and Fis domain